MGKDPAFLFYPGDWLGGTMGMTFEEKGAYMELLMLQFNRGHMTKDMIGHTVGQLWGQIQDKFIQDDKGLWFNERLDEEKLKRQNYTLSRKNNKTGNNQHTKEKGHMTSHMENEDVNKSEYKFKEFVDDFKRLSKRTFRGCAPSKRQFAARLKEGYKRVDFVNAITNLYGDSYHIETGFKYATPEFITRSDKLEKFINQVNKKTHQAGRLNVGDVDYDEEWKLKQS